MIMIVIMMIIIIIIIIIIRHEHLNFISKCVSSIGTQPITSPGEIVHSKSASLSQQTNRRFGLTLVWT